MVLAYGVMQLIRRTICILLDQISADGKSASIWDTFSSDPTHSEDGGNTSTATETYTKWQEDIVLMRSYGVNSYRLSLSWTRILPDGVAGSKVNKAGVEWYRKVLKGLLEAGIVSSHLRVCHKTSIRDSMTDRVPNAPPTDPFRRKSASRSGSEKGGLVANPGRHADLVPLGPSTSVARQVPRFPVL
jgi:hypothetical protein